MRTRILCSY